LRLFADGKLTAFILCSGVQKRNAISLCARIYSGTNASTSCKNSELVFELKYGRKWSATTWRNLTIVVHSARWRSETD